MTTYTMLQELDKSGKLKEFSRRGIVPVKVVVHYEIAQRFNEEFEKAKGCKGCKVQAVTFTADAFRVSEKTVYKALQAMQSI